MAERRGISGKKRPLVQSENWQSVYAALIMIMLVFFLMLLSHSRIGEENVRKLQKTVADKTGNKEVRSKIREYEMAASLRGRMAISGLSNGIAMTGGRVRLTLERNALFEPGGSVLLPSGRLVLREVVNHARKYQSHLQVRVITDCRMGADGIAKPNWELASMRAAVLYRYLSGEGAYPEQRLASEAQGISCAGAARAEEREGMETMILFLNP